MAVHAIKIIAITTGLLRLWPLIQVETRQKAGLLGCWFAHGPGFRTVTDCRRATCSAMVVIEVS